MTSESKTPNITNYTESGYALEKNFFSSELIDEVFTEIMEKQHKLTDGIVNKIENQNINPLDYAIENGNLKYLKNVDLYFNKVKKLANSKLHKIVNNLIGEDSYLDLYELHQKFPGASHTPAHQDNFYFCLKDGKSLTAYIPLNDQVRENGSMAVLPKSHNLNLEHYPSDTPGFSSGVKLSSSQLDNVDYYSLNAGDLSVHHCNIVHLADQNISSKVRINIAIRFKAVNTVIDNDLFKRYEKFRSSSIRQKS